MPLLVAFIAAAVLIASTPVEAAQRKMALGVSDTALDLEQFKASAGGRYPALWTLWSTWGVEDPGQHNYKMFPTAKVKDLPAGVTPFIFWEPAVNAEVCSDHSRFRKVMRGKFDGYIKKWARAAKRTQRPVIVRFAHEINGRYFPWTIGKCGNKTEHYLKAWRRVHNLVRNKIGAKNVKFAWTVNRNKPGRGFGANPYAQFFPGKRYVQYMGYSSFNWGEVDGKTWKEMLQGVKGITQKLMQLSKKPIIVAELATNHVGGNKAAWIRDGYREVFDALPRIKAVVYLNVDLSNIGHPNWRLNSPDSGPMDAYIGLFEEPRFRGKIR